MSSNKPFGVVILSDRFIAKVGLVTVSMGISDEVAQMM